MDKRSKISIYEIYKNKRIVKNRIKRKVDRYNGLIIALFYNVERINEYYDKIDVISIDKLKKLTMFNKLTIDLLRDGLNKQLLILGKMDMIF